MNERESAYRGSATVSSRDAHIEGPQVVFYQLVRKFVDDDRSVPEEAKDMLYYTLAVGHHTGVIDCFEEKLRCSLAVFRSVVGRFEADGPARYKLEGIMRSGEIQIDKSHLQTLAPEVREVYGKLEATGDPGLDDELAWLGSLLALLDVLADNGVVYLMGRMRDA